MSKLDTFTLKKDWTSEHHKLFNTIPAIVRDIAGDLFEIKWYGQANYSDMMWEVENNLLGEKYAPEFKKAYDSLTPEQKNLIYYAYEV